MWLRKGEKPDPSLLAGIAPPPTASPMDVSPATSNDRARSAPAVTPASTTTMASPAAPAPNADPPCRRPVAAPGAMPTMPPSLGDSGNKFSKGRQRRYIDTMNNGVVHASNPTSNGLIFEKPAAAPSAPASVSAFAPTAFVPSAGTESVRTGK
jgi:hypothetical protein